MEQGRRVDPTNLIGPEKVKQAVTCPICLLIVTLPVYRCQECGNHFCQNCLVSWWQSKHKQKEKVCIYGCQKPEIKLLKRVTTLNTMLDLLEFPCRNEGCDRKSSFDNFRSHENECDWLVVTCSNEGCPQKSQRKNIKQHKKQCQWKIVQCQYCNKDTKIMHLHQHEEDCEQRKEPCTNSGCNQIIVKKHHKQHVNNCPYRQIPCRWCSTNTKAMDLALHQDGCQQKKIECPGCQKLQVKHQYEQHISDCEDIIVFCQLCDERFSRKGFLNHNMQQCMIKSIKDLRKENKKLWEQNIQLKLSLQKLQDNMENFSSGKMDVSADRSKQISNSVVQTMRKQEMAVLEKDIERLVYSINSIEKLRKEQVQAHLKFPHLIESWCAFCKELDRKFTKMLEPLVQKKRQLQQRRAEHQNYTKTRR